jgi:hypothetical protein
MSVALSHINKYTNSNEQHINEPNKYQRFLTSQQRICQQKRGDLDATPRIPSTGTAAALMWQYAEKVNGGQPNANANALLGCGSNLVLW